MTLSFLARRSHTVVLIGLLLLFVIISVITLMVPGCGRSPNMVIWGLNVLPLVIVSPGILRGGPRSGIWLCFLLLGYFAVSVAGLFGCATWLAWAEMVVIVVLFIASMLFSRWQAKLNNEEQSVE